MVAETNTYCHYIPGIEKPVQIPETHHVIISGKTRAGDLIYHTVPGEFRPVSIPNTVSLYVCVIRRHAGHWTSKLISAASK